MALNAEEIKGLLSSLHAKKEQAEMELKEHQFQLEKLEEQRKELKSKIIAEFGTDEPAKLKEKLRELQGEAEGILAELSSQGE